jgi:hypothetical protein
MTFELLTAVTAARLVVCPAFWLWCWLRRPPFRHVGYGLDLFVFLLTDHLDGVWAREYGLTSRLGYWLDHVGDFLFYFVVIVTGIASANRGALVRRKRKVPPRVPEGEGQREQRAGDGRGDGGPRGPEGAVGRRPEDVPRDRDR